jgi:hypothetical protein
MHAPGYRGRKRLFRPGGLSKVIVALETASRPTSQVAWPPSTFAPKVRTSLTRDSSRMPRRGARARQQAGLSTRSRPARRSRFAVGTRFTALQAQARAIAAVATGDPREAALGLRSSCRR